MAKKPRAASKKAASRKKPKPKQSAGGVESRYLAALFDCTTRQIELLAKEGIAVRVGHGRYDAEASTRNYIVHLRKQASGHVGADKNADAIAANVGLRIEQALWTRRRREMLEGEAVKIADVRATWARLMQSVRGLVLGLPGQVAFAVPTLTKHDQKQIETIAREGLDDLALGRGYRVGKSESGDASD